MYDENENNNKKKIKYLNIYVLAFSHLFWILCCVIIRLKYFNKKYNINCVNINSFNNKMF
jgi:hypothetical protein